jgi:hypothetical protein
MAVILLNTVFWVVTPFTSERARGIGGIYHLRLQDQDYAEQETSLSPASTEYVLGLLYCSELEVVCSSETSTCLETKRRYNPEHGRYRCTCPQHHYCLRYSCRCFANFRGRLRILILGSNPAHFRSRFCVVRCMYNPILRSRQLCSH